MTDFILQNVPSSSAWSSLTNATANLTLANGTNTTEFDQTSNTTWTWKNTTTATNSTTNASPTINLVDNYWTGAASAADTWTIGSSLAAGTNGATTLTISHSGSSGLALVSVPQIFSTSGFSLATAGAVTQGLSASGSTTLLRGTQIFIANSAGTNFLIATSSGIQVGAVVTKYNGINTISNGVPSEYATVDLTAQSAAISATTAYATTATGMYRISWSADITTASDISSTLGGANGFQILYTSPTDSVVKTTVAGNSVTSSANTTGTAVGGTIVVYAKTGTNIQYQFGYTDSHTSTAMQYELHIKIEAM